MRRVRQAAKLRAYHYTAVNKHMSCFGLGLVSGTVRNDVNVGVLEPVLAKLKLVQARAAGSAARCQLVQQPVEHVSAAWHVPVILLIAAKMSMPRMRVCRKC